jgi:protein phosphatase
MQTLDIRFRTSRGKRRRQNEDAVLVRSKKQASGKGSPVYLLAVADGMGGAPGGRVAGRETVRSLGDTFAKDQKSNPQALLQDGFRSANARIGRLAGQQPSLQGMRSTLVAVIVSKRQAWVANVGDSRAYLIRNGQARRLTHDHTWVAEQVKSGQMTEEEASTSPRRNIITRCVGSKETFNVDLLGPLSLQPDDVMLLCSDGLTGVVSDAEIAAACSNTSAAAAAQELVSLANRRGGSDDISVVVGRAHDAATETPTARSSPVARVSEHGRRADDKHGCRTGFAFSLVSARACG